MEKEYIVRVQSNTAYSYGLGEVVAQNCAYFPAGSYNLTKDELNAKLKQLRKVTLR